MSVYKRDDDQPGARMALPPLTRAMAASIAVLGGVWILAALLAAFPLGASGGGALGWFERLALVPARTVERHQYWRLVTYALLHDPRSLAAPVFTALTLWLFGGSMEAAWGLRRLAVMALVSSVTAALVVVLGGHLYLPWWQEVTLSPTAFESALVVAWCVVHGTRTVSFLGMVQLTGRKLALLTLGLGLVGFAMSRSGQAMASLVGMGVGWAFAWRARFRPQPTPRRSRLHAMSSPRLRVLDGGRDDLPN